MKIAHVRESNGEVEPLLDHLCETACISGKLASKIGMEKIGTILGLIHDIGKGSTEFQNYILSASGYLKPGEADYVDPIKSKGRVNHSSAGAEFIHSLGNINCNVKEIIEAIVLSHHGGLPDFVSIDGDGFISKRIKKPTATANSDELFKGIDDNFTNIVLNHIEPELMLDEYRCMQNRYKQEQGVDLYLFMIGMTIKFLYSCLIDADRTTTANFMSPHNKLIRNSDFRDWDTLIEKLDAHISKFQIRNNIDELRGEISEYCFNKSAQERGIYQLTVPTGGGKTFASLRFALNHAKIHEMDRIIYIVPYTSIIDQNANDVRKILEKEMELGSIVLEHHSNLTSDEETEKTKLISENWDAPIVFTTMVQFLESIFKGGTRSIRRLHQLANSVIIFDEIQTINVNHVYLFNFAIRYFADYCDSTVVLCTATQPLLDKVVPDKYCIKIDDNKRIIENAKKYFDQFSRVSLTDLTSREDWTNLNTLELALKELRKGKNVLVVVNTKRYALELAELASEYSSEFSLHHLSTAMCASHRMDELSKIRENLSTEKDSSFKPTLCVSTQLIEAGVDIDFDCVIRHIAGIDSIIQAAGRCNRHGLQKEKGSVYVVSPRDEMIVNLRDIRRGIDATRSVIHDLKVNETYTDNDIMSLKAIEMYFNLYFYSCYKDMEYKVRIVEHKVTESIPDLLSENYNAHKLHIKQNGEKMNHPFAFKTAGKYFKALDESTQGVIVPYELGGTLINELCSSDDPGFISEKLKTAQRYSVNVFTNKLQNLLKNKVIFETRQGSGIYCLSEAYYNKHYGLTSDPYMEPIVL